MVSDQSAGRVIRFCDPLIENYEDPISILHRMLLVAARINGIRSAIRQEAQKSNAPRI